MPTMKSDFKNNFTILDKPRLDKIYFGVCYIFNSVERCEKIKQDNAIFFTKSIDDLNSLKNIVRRIYYKNKFELPIFSDYIDCQYKIFNKKISAVILDTIYRTAAMANNENSKEISDLNIIIMVLANMLKSLI